MDPYYGQPAKKSGLNPEPKRRASSVKKRRDPTLFVCTLPLPIFEGQYVARKITAEQAAAEIRESVDHDQIESMVHAGTTARLLTEISGRVIKRVEKPRLPKPVDGDWFLCVRLATDLHREHGKQPLGILDVDFLLVVYTEEPDQLEQHL